MKNNKLVHYQRFICDIESFIILVLMIIILLIFLLTHTFYNTKLLIKNYLHQLLIYIIFKQVIIFLNLNNKQ